MKEYRFEIKPITPNKVSGICKIVRYEVSYPEGQKSYHGSQSNCWNAIRIYARKNKITCLMIYLLKEE